MKITVYGAASTSISEKYVAAVEKLGEKIAERGHELVFGGGKTGLMGAAARGVKAKGGRITGIVPKFFKEKEVEILFDECDENIWTEDMYERKRLLEELCDAFVITPGGMGTYDEFFGVVTTKQLDRHFKPIAVLNVDGFYDKLMDFIRHAVDEKFIKPHCFDLFKAFDSAEGICEYLEEELGKKSEKDYKFI